MPYPPRPSKKPLERFVGTAGTHQTPERRAELIAFVASGYYSGSTRRARTPTSRHRATRLLETRLHDLVAAPRPTRREEPET